MQELITTLLPWLLSAGGMLTMWLSGNKSLWAWRISLCNQVLWFTWIYLTANYGFIPVTVMVIFIASRNLRKWKKEGLSNATT